MSVSNVNFFSGFFTGMPVVTKANYMDTVVKALVSGFDPLLIESITVSDKVARVTTTAKDFYCIPGVKININGTGVAAIDTRQEIQEVFTDGFTFEIETPDAVFNNGLSFYYSPLGWSILKQNANQYIFKAGNGANTEFFLVFEIYSSTNNSNNWQGYICYELNRSNNPSKFFPSSGIDYLQLLPIHSYSSTNATQWAWACNWYFYGDDAFITLCSKFGTAAQLSNKSIKNISSACWGECSNPIGQLSYHLAGGVIIDTAFFPVYPNINQASFSSSIINGVRSTVNLFSYLGIKSYSNSTNYFPVSSIFPKRNPASYSGRSFGTPSYYSNSFKLDFYPLEIVDLNYNKYCDVPGVYAFETFPINYGIDPFLSNKIIIKNKIRNVAFVKTTSATNDPYGGTSDINTPDAVTIFDLTGPIR